MKVSLNTVTQYIDFELPPVDELVKRINEQLGGVEQVTDLSRKYKDAVIVKVVARERHPNADRLHVCRVDDGGVVADVPRDENGLVQVVCGAPNVHADMYAVWLPPKATVPASYDDEEPFVLAARELRGVLSQGMMAAGDELAISSDHDRIVEIDPSEWKPSGAEIKPGASFAAAFGLDDTIIDIENKMFTHRPDLFGQLGIATELAGIFGSHSADLEDIYSQHSLLPDWYWNMPKFEAAEGLELTVANEAETAVPRLMTVAVKDVVIKPSPLWLQCALVAMGSKPINNVVDITNYMMLLTAQPTHAYDYDKLRGHTLMARMARAGESVTLLNGKTYELTVDDIVMADAEGPVGLAGIMGGGDSEVSSETKNIVLEVATFDMYAVRKTSMRYGLFTDALTRFNKGQSPLQNDKVLDRLTVMMGELAGGVQASSVADLLAEKYNDAKANGSLAHDIRVEPEFITARLGLSLAPAEIEQLLRNVWFACYVPEEGTTAISFTAPFWRTDIEQPEDIVEEIGRLYGFDKLPRELPARTMRPTPQNVKRQLLDRVRTSLAKAGANEVLTYSFVHENILAKAGQNAADAYRLSNALSPDLQYYRLSITPSLLDKIHANIRAGYDEFALFEIGKVHSKAAEADDEGLPPEPGRIALAYAAKKPAPGAAYYQAKQLLETLASNLGLALEYRDLPASSNLAAAAPFEAKRAARIIDTASGVPLGYVGEYKATVRRAFKLPEYSAGFELLTEGLMMATSQVAASYTPLSRYPAAERDVCFEVADDVSYGRLMTVIQQTMSELSMSATISPVDIYRAENELRRITVRLRLVSYERTLENEEIAAAVERIQRAAAQAVGATVI